MAAMRVSSCYDVSSVIFDCVLRLTFSFFSTIMWGGGDADPHGRWGGLKLCCLFNRGPRGSDAESLACLSAHPLAGGCCRPPARVAEE